jgi:hypothetical protein
MNNQGTICSAVNFEGAHVRRRQISDDQRVRQGL